MKKLSNMVFALVFTALVSQFTVAQGQAPVSKSQEQQKRDELRAAIQDICPVSGGKLGSMGKPIKVQVGKETIFLCCKGCIGKEIKPEHWATIHTNVARAQHICPVMKKELPKSPKWTLVEGQIVYVCCPPCTKKIAADPQTYLREVDQLYIEALDARKQNR